MRANAFLSILLAFFLTESASGQSTLRTWSESSVADFSDGQLTNLVVTSVRGGEVQFPHPLRKTLDDTASSDPLRFAARDSAGRAAVAVNSGGNIFLRMYNADGTLRSGNILVNRTGGLAASECKPRTALYNDGTCLVSWTLDSYEMRGQIVVHDTVLVDTSFVIAPAPNHANPDAAVGFANETDQTFWLFFMLLTPEGDYPLYVQRRDKLGRKLGETWPLNSDRVARNELQPAVIGDGQGFVVAYVAGGGSVLPANWQAVLVRRYDASGNPLALAVTASEALANPYQIEPSMCRGGSGNILVAWDDYRNYEGPSQPDTWQPAVYGQLFSPTLSRIGTNVQLASGQRVSTWNPWLTFDNGEYRLTYRSAGGEYQNRWQYAPVFSGMMVSSIFDAGPGGALLDTIAWKADMPAGTTLKFRVRTAASAMQLLQSPWYGLSDTGSYYSASTGTPINPAHRSGRFVQYQASFAGTDGNSAVLDSVAISFTPADTVKPSAPTHLAVQAGHGRVILSWDQVPDPDLAGYSLYRGDKSGQYDPAWTQRCTMKGTTFVDSTALAGRPYFYAVSATDSSHNEGPLSSEVACLFPGTNIYVSASAPAGGDGSLGLPFQTIAAAQNVALFGDTIKVLPGACTEAVVMKRGVSLVGVDAGLCRVDGTAGAYATITGADECLIGRLSITGSIDCKGTSPSIVGNIITIPPGQPCRTPAAIISNSSGAPFIAKNFITGGGVDLFVVYGGTVRNNIFFQSPCFVIRAMAILSHLRIWNNTIIGTGNQGITTDGADIQNNILVGTGTSSPGAIQWLNGPAPGDSVRQIRYNDVWHTMQTSLPWPDNIIANPAFMDTLVQDFRLREGSPCKDAGNPDPAFRDADGSRNDMGAFGGPDPFEGGFAPQVVHNIAVSRVSASPGDTVAVEISIDNASGLWDMALVFSYDAALLHFVTADRTEASAGGLLLVRGPGSGGSIQITLHADNGFPSAGGSLVRLLFLVDRNAGLSDGSPLTISSLALTDIHQHPMIVRSVTDGAVAITRFPESAHRIFVDGAVTGGQDGSLHRPFKTIAQALTKAGAGDSIIVAAGEYHETIAMKQGIHLIGSGAAVTSLVGPGGLVSAYLVQFINITEGEVSGFTLRSDYSAGPVQVFFYCVGSTPLITRCHLMGPSGGFPGLWIIDCPGGTIRNNYLTAADVEISGSSPLFTGNTCVADGALGRISATDSDPAFVGNTITGVGISINRGATTGGGTLLRNNRFVPGSGGPSVAIGLLSCQGARVFNNLVVGSGEGIPYDGGVTLTEATGCEIRNNTLLTSSIGLWEDNSSSTILNNIICAGGQCGVNRTASSVSNYNDIWGGGVAYYGGETPGANDLMVNPQFVDSAAGDYHLRPGSPCINAGAPGAEYNDADGSRNDMGAYGGPFADSSHTGGSVFAVDSASVAASDTLTVKVRGKGIGGVASMDLNLRVDPQVLSLIDATVGSATRLCALEKTSEAPGRIHLRLTAVEGIRQDSGVVATLRAAVLVKGSATTTIWIDSARALNEETSPHDIAGLHGGSVSITPTSVGGGAAQALPTQFELFQNYPNPFNPATTIRYALPVRSRVHLEVFNVLGQQVAELVNATEEGGYHAVIFDAGRLASGVYFYRITAAVAKPAGQGSFTRTFKALVVK